MPERVLPDEITAPGIKAQATILDGHKDRIAIRAPVARIAGNIEPAQIGYFRRPENRAVVAVDCHNPFKSLRKESPGSGQRPRLTTIAIRLVTWTGTAHPLRFKFIGNRGVGQHLTPKRRIVGAAVLVRPLTRAGQGRLLEMDPVASVTGTDIGLHTVLCKMGLKNIGRLLLRVAR